MRRKLGTRDGAGATALAALCAFVWLTANATAAPCDRAAFRTVLDVGHTPESPGAMSARGVMEFDFNLRLGQRIERELQAKGFEKTTLLVTRGQAQPALMARVASANNARADLFISIHHDSVPEALLASWDFLGAEGRHNDQFKGHSIFVSVEHPQYVRSLAFARALGLAMKENGLAYTPHYTEKIMGARRRQLVDREAGVYRFDKLVVLTLTKMPAVLLEAGSIINRDEELAMDSPERQAQIAEAVADAVGRFCAAQRSRAPKRATN
jgi:N-acetylmuramoyl-L-alanine amidase